MARCGGCHPAGGSQYAAFWVGLDGYAGKTVEQIGTEADCTGPSPGYYAWYEVYPGAGVNFTNPVSPGDKFAIAEAPPAASNERRAAARPGWGCGRRSRSA